MSASDLSLIAQNALRINIKQPTEVKKKKLLISRFIKHVFLPIKSLAISFKKLICYYVKIAAAACEHQDLLLRVRF